MSNDTALLGYVEDPTSKMIFLRNHQGWPDQHAYVYEKVSHKSVEEHLLTCEYVSSSASGFSAVDKGIANRIKQDIQSLDVTASEMYTVSCFGQSIIGLLVTCWAECRSGSNPYLPA